MHNSDQLDVDINVVGNNVEQHTMGVVVSAKVFSMNVDGIYQDKFGSTVRELSTNAVDIHRECGIMDKPFDIHIPSQISGKFIIRDYGCGLSKDGVINFFGKLFSTSKDQDNNSVGFYGIGCKSPFTVTDDFLVITRHNGIKTTFAFTRENKGIPRYIILSSVECDEPSGIEIVIDAGDTETWINAIRMQLVLFPIRPNVFMDGQPYEINYPKIRHFGDVRVVSELPHSLYIEQGGVIYPIDKRQFDGVPFKESYFVNQAVVYSCDIGMITIPPDRERIEVTESNKNNLMDIVTKSNQTIEGAALQYYKDNYTRGHKSYCEVGHYIRPLVNIDELVKDIHTDKSFTNDVKIISGCIHSFITAMRTQINYISSDIVVGSPDFYESDNGKYKKCKSYHSFKKMLTGDHDIFILSSGVTISQLYDMKRKTHKSLYIIRAKKGKEHIIESAIKSLQDYFGSESSIDVTIVTKPVVANNIIKFKPQKNVVSVISAKDILESYFLKLNGNNSYMSWSNYNMSKNDMVKGDYYIVSIDNNSYPSPTVPAYKYDVDEIRYIFDNLDKPVYFMREKYFKLLKHGTKTDINALVDKFKTMPNYLEMVFNRKWGRTFKYYNLNTIKIKLKNKKEYLQVCESIGFDLNNSQYVSSEVIRKFDIFGDYGCSLLSKGILSTIKINKNEMRKLVLELYK